MKDDRLELRAGNYSGVYLDSLCVWCGVPVKQGGSRREDGSWSPTNGGVVWIPTDPDVAWRDQSTCWGHEVKLHAFAGHEPWEAIRVPFVVPREQEIRQARTSRDACHVMR